MVEKNPLISGVIDTPTNVLFINSNGSVNIDPIYLTGVKGRIGIQMGKNFLVCADSMEKPKDGTFSLYMEKYPTYNFLYRKEEEKTRKWILFGFSSPEYGLMRFSSTTGGKVNMKLPRTVGLSLLNIKDEYHYDHLLVLKKGAKLIIDEILPNSKRTVNVEFTGTTGFKVQAQ